MIERQSEKEAAHMRAVGIILSEAERMAGIVKKIGKITKYETTDYVGGARMLDLDRAAPDSNPAMPIGSDETQTGDFQPVTPSPDDALAPSLSDFDDLAQRRGGSR